MNVWKRIVGLFKRSQPRRGRTLAEMNEAKLPDGSLLDFFIDYVGIDRDTLPSKHEAVIRARAIAPALGRSGFFGKEDYVNANFQVGAAGIIEFQIGRRHRATPAAIVDALPHFTVCTKGGHTLFSTAQTTPDRPIFIYCFPLDSDHYEIARRLKRRDEERLMDNGVWAKMVNEYAEDFKADLVPADAR